MSWRKALGAVVLAGSVAVPVGAVLAHGHKPVSHPGGPPSAFSSGVSGSVPSSIPSSPPARPPSGLPSAVSGHGNGVTQAAAVHSLVQANQTLQREIVAERLSTLSLMQQIRMVLVTDEQSGNTAAVTQVDSTLTTLITDAQTAIKDQHLALASAAGTSSSSSPGATTALTNIQNLRAAEYAALVQLDSGLQALLTGLNATPPSSSSSPSTPSSSRS